MDSRARDCSVRPRRLGYRPTCPWPSCASERDAPQASPPLCCTKSLPRLQSHPLSRPPALWSLSPPRIAGRCQRCSFTAASEVPRPSAPLSFSPPVSPHPEDPSWPAPGDQLEPSAPASAPLTRAVETGGDRVQEGVLWGQQPLHDWHGLGARVRGLAVGCVQLGQAQGGALPAGPGRPMRPPASYPLSNRRRLSAPNPAAFAWARRRLGGSFPLGPDSFPPGSARARHVAPHGEGPQRHPHLSLRSSWGRGAAHASLWRREFGTRLLKEEDRRGGAELECQIRLFPGGHAPACGSLALLLAPPHGLPYSPPTLGKVSGSLCCLPAGVGPPCSALRTLLFHCETARVKEASFAGWG